MRTGLAPTLTGSSLFSFQGTGAVQRRIPSLSQATLEVKSFFSGPPGGGLLSESALGFSRVLLAGKIGPGHRRGRGRYGSCPGMSSVKLLRSQKRRAGDRTAPSPGGRRRVRATRRQGPKTRSGARRERFPVRRTDPNPPRVNRFPPPHLSVFELSGRLSLSIGRRNPTKVGFRLEERARRHSSAGSPAGNRSRRPSTVHPPARSAARVAG